MFDILFIILAFLLKYPVLGWIGIGLIAVKIIIITIFGGVIGFFAKLF